MTRTIAFATCRARPEITTDDALVGRHLPPGVRLRGVPWDEPGRDWAGFDAVVLRSTWDYHERHREFADWLAGLERAGARVWNPPALVRWNLEKTYLGELARRGIEVVPTHWLEQGAKASLARILAAEGWRRVVVKPTVAASSWGLFTAERDSADALRPELDRALARGGVMIQPLIREVVEEGEWSLVFLAGEPSHAVIKRPRHGEVRVQSDFGGSVEPAAAPDSMVRWAAGCLAAVDRRYLYARVDAVATSSGPLLMELEMIEPQLFLGSAQGAPARLAAALAGFLDSP